MLVASQIVQKFRAAAIAAPCAFVHGPGGIGKTTLLLELRARGRAAGRTVVLLDGREVDASPEGFEHAIPAACGRPREGQPGTVAADLLVNALLLVDGYEQLAPIDVWLRQEFIPALAAGPACRAWLAGYRGGDRNGASCSECGCRSRRVPRTMI